MNKKKASSLMEKRDAPIRPLSMFEIQCLCRVALLGNSGAKKTLSTLGIAPTIAVF